MMPRDLVLVRHGQSEGNAAKRLSEAGDHSAFTEAFRNRHPASFRLTAMGRRQAARAGEVIRALFCQHQAGFDRYLTSEYARAMETAGLLGLHDAGWFADYYLTERDWGELDVCPEDEREEKFGEALKRYAVEPFFWRPPGGESFVDLCLRVDRVLHTLHRECSDKRVIVVCHGEVMRAFRVRLERLSQERFRELTFPKTSEDRIFNCEIVHYTRYDPASVQPALHMNWVRHIRPTGANMQVTAWRRIVRPRYSNGELLHTVSKFPAMIE